MICSSCGAQNRAGRKFCSECGAALTLPCPSCGTLNEPQEKFCGECGSPLSLQAPPPAPIAPAPIVETPSAERRLVSVLFADLVGFTTLSEHRDAEEVRDLLTRYFDAARELITRYGGIVEKFIGDAVMAVWGTPVAHEDDPERAVRAALEMTEAVVRLGVQVGADDLRLRAGVLTGEAAVTVGAQGQGMVAGDLVNTASRLQSAAAPGTVFVGESTYLAANKAIIFEEAGAHKVKGKERTVSAWRALRVVAGHQGFRRSEGLEAPFVGRDEELRLIKELFHATGREKRPRLASVVGIGGIGKSRLAWEFFKYIDGLVEDTFWHQGRCPAYGEGVTFWALGEMVRMRARIAEGEDPTSSRQKLTGVLEEHIPDPDERRWIETRLIHLLGFEEGPAAEREELFAAWRTFFERISDRGTTVLLLEDLQWADTGLVDFIEHMLEWTRSHPIFIITLSRPDFIERRPTWGAGQRNFVSLHLEPLTNDAMVTLLSGLAKGLPDEVVAQVVDRAEGVPLYAVETVRMLIDQRRLVREGQSFRLSGEVARLDVPDTLHSLIASRLDVLEAADRRLLQDASVLGKTFTLEAVTAVTDQPSDDIEVRLKALVRRELLDIEADPRSPERGQYGFVQSLIREVAYQTLSKVDRQSRHVRAARYFEGTGDDELASVVATHYIEAWRAIPKDVQAETLAAKARAALLTAAERAGSLGVHEQALAYIDQALTVTDDPVERARLWESAAESARNAAAFEKAKDYLNRALLWHEQQGDLAAVRRSTAELGRVLLGMGQIDAAIEKLETALADLDDLEFDVTAAQLASNLARALALKTDSHRSIEWADRALVAGERLDLVTVVADALIWKGLAGHFAGRWREAVALMTGALALAEKEDLVFQQVAALFDLSFLLGMVSPPDAMAAARRALELSRKRGLREWELLSAGNACEFAIFTGEWHWIVNTIDVVSRGEMPEPSLVQLTSSHAIVMAARGDPHHARARLEVVETIAQASTDQQLLGMYRLAESWIALVDGRLDEAYQRGMAAADVSPGGDYAVRGHIMAARAATWARNHEGTHAAYDALCAMYLHGPWSDLNRRTIEAGLALFDGRRDEAIDLFSRAIAAWRGLGVPFDLALSELDFIILVGVDNPEARKAADEAREILDGLGAKPFVARLDAAMASEDATK